MTGSSPCSRKWFIVRLLATVGLSMLAKASPAAPQLSNISLRGLKIGSTTTLTIEGADLLPDPRVVLSVPIASQTIHSGATASRCEVDVKLGQRIAPGFYNLRVANAKGISNALVISIDTLEQMPFASGVMSLPTALHGSLGDSPSLKTSFAGKKGQHLIVDIEARRLGAAFDPVLELYNPAHVLMAIAQPQQSLGGDARLQAVLPADGSYGVELHDLLYRPGEPRFFRLKLGELCYADLVFPMGARRSTTRSFELIGNSPSSPPSVNMELRTFLPELPGSLPVRPGATGPAPPILVSDFPEIEETPQPPGKLQEVAVPVIINGRISAPGEVDRYLVHVKAGMRLRFDLIANRAGSALDAVLELRNESGALQAESDDRQDSGRLGFTQEFDRSVEVSVVGERERWHIERLGALYQVRDLAGAVQEAVMAVAMKMHEGLAGHRRVSVLRWPLVPRAAGTPCEGRAR